ncbi:Inositol 2-dehydrogenase/D-chiro-inositol 3-dehydrogenase [Streptomyces sp. RB5]|uniref:Inositol 2-dehydrogenase/D-chiro-inositol 3-dehydrogenase n=1 Tax=Streptomyces smaragdinus TaxID=2585196 RepID=A0A7K0CPU1_9ACTN|nr:Gfo/Idh/MocA family oxidoreductase [Streptomyces smaragdinus]MQY15510.1 Inositol 2-dehydrogenase/D-chiro-inositol 3-dehydrogenase [Streptomyces smaragdinus]
MSFGIALIGCGYISDQYLTNLTAFPDLDVLFCADLDEDRARSQAAAYGVPGAGGVAQALAHPDVRLIVNLTVPAAHYDVASAAIGAGKHVWNEKPLTLDPASGRKLLTEARQAGVRLGCAPDTFLGAGLQTARRLIDAGAIGEPQSALALMQTPGPESWHPSPEFYFLRGGGPLYDMGPYYLTALASLFGPASRVAATSRRARPTRTIGSGPKAGTDIPVEVPTHVAALIDYASGPAAALTLSFDSPLPRQGFVEVTGTEATLALPDPNRFDGSLRLRPLGSSDWTVIESEGATAGRGIGALDMARCIAAGVPHRASGELAQHVLETMAAVEASAAEGEFRAVGGSFPLPPALAPGWDPYGRG